MLSLVAMGLAVFIGNDPFKDEDFDAAVWRSAKRPDPKSPRGPMITDLRQRYLQPGRDRNEIIALLGEADVVHQDELFPGPNAATFVDRLGGPEVLRTAEGLRS